MKGLARYRASPFLVGRLTCRHGEIFQALETQADGIAIACFFCRTMPEDDINALKGDRDIQVMNTVEMVWEVLQETQSRS